MLDYLTLARLIEEDRRREIEAAARVRMARPRGGSGPGLSRTARRSVGGMLVRVGVWLAMSGAASTSES